VDASQAPTQITFSGDLGHNPHSILLKQGAELEMKDIHGWTALFHCTSAGHQQMVKFLLESGANANVR
jgi:ankyrin repeat protein